MAILRLGILSGFNNKIGNVVGFKWNNLDVIRSYVIPANPRTVLQTGVRNFFRTTVRFATICGRPMPKIKAIWQSLVTGKQTWFSNVVQANYGFSGSETPTELNIITPDSGAGVSLTNIEAVDNSLSFKVPILQNVMPIDSADNKVSFQIAYCFKDSSDPKDPPFSLASQEKNVDNYNFAATYNFSLEQSGYVQYLATKYQAIIVFIALIIEDTDGVRTKFTKTIPATL